MKQICVVGVGYVGLVTAACFADLGNRVVALDVDEKRVENLKKGVMPIYEPGLEELVKRNVKGGRITFTTSYEDALNDVVTECALQRKERVGVGNHTSVVRHHRACVWSLVLNDPHLVEP